MDGFVSKKSLFEEFEKAAWFNNADRDDVAEELLLKAPCIDVVEVVRCKYCRYVYWQQEPCHGRIEYYCPKVGSAVDKYFYCGAGDRG